MLDIESVGSKGLRLDYGGLGLFGKTEIALLLSSNSDVLYVK